MDYYRLLVTKIVIRILFHKHCSSIIFTLVLSQTLFTQTLLQKKLLNDYCFSNIVKQRLLHKYY